MASFEITGNLKLKQETQVVSEKFSKREFVLTIDQATQYPQYISLQLTQDKCSLIDNINVGEEIKVSFNLRGREWNGGDKGIKYFNSLEAWRVERTANQGQTTASAPASAPIANPVLADAPAVDDLPF